MRRLVSMCSIKKEDVIHSNQSSEAVIVVKGQGCVYALHCMQVMYSGRLQLKQNSKHKRQWPRLGLKSGSSEVQSAIFNQVSGLTMQK